MLDPKLLVGKQIERYQILEHIATGGMADVYLAFDETLHRKIALKILLPMYANDAQFVNRFRREARTAAALDHPNIIQVFEVGNTPDNRPYIAMQYVEGGTLKKKLQELQGRSMPVEEALVIVRQVAVALGVAHAENVVHRDVKPSNVLLKPDGTPVIVDLGIAAVKMGQKLTQTGTLIGTPLYMSPEQVGGAKLDGRSDIYSLGVMLYQLLASRPPFEAEDPLAVLHDHLYEEPPPLPNLRPGLSPQTYRLVHTCLLKDPEERYRTAGEMVLAIDQAIQSEQGVPTVVDQDWTWPSEDPEETLYKPRQDETQRPKRPWWLLALIPIVLLALFGVYQLFKDGIGGDDVTPTPPDVLVSGTDLTQVPVLIVTQLVEVTTAVETLSVDPEPTATIPPIPTDTPQPAPPTDTPMPSPTATPTIDLGPERIEIGRSVSDRAIEAVRLGAGETVVFFIGGLHAGAAPSSVSLAQRALNHFQLNPELVPSGITLYIIPSANPDSPRAPGELAGRLNANDVDLNRNWDCRWVRDAKWRNQVVPGSGGPSPFSEPETQALVNFFSTTQVDAVVFWEARAANGLVSPGSCGDRPVVSGRLASAYGLSSGYSIADFEDLTNQVVNGDGTNYLDSQGIAAVSILLPDYEQVDWNNNLNGILGVLAEYNQ